MTDGHDGVSHPHSTNLNKFNPTILTPIPDSPKLLSSDFFQTLLFLRILRKNDKKEENPRHNQRSSHSLEYREVFPYLIQDEGVQVRHVALVGDGTLVVIFKVLLQRHGVMWDLHHRAQVVGQHLE